VRFHGSTFIFALFFFSQNGITTVASTLITRLTASGRLKQSMITLNVRLMPFTANAICDIGHNPTSVDNG